MIKIYTDGSCLKNPGGPGGWAFVVVDNDQIVYECSGGCNDTTNNRMELCAILQALSWLGECSDLKQKSVIITDSQYAKNGIELWSKNWIKNGWQNANGKPIKNIDIWKEILARSNVLDINWEWVRGHSGNMANERADELAKLAAKNIN